MARKTNIEIVMDGVLHADRQREAMRARELRRMNELAARGLLDNAAQRGALENAVKGVVPVLMAQAPKRRGRR